MRREAVAWQHWIPGFANGDAGKESEKVDGNQPSREQSPRHIERDPVGWYSAKDSAIKAEHRELDE